jgi:hypothetical protein
MKKWLKLTLIVLGILLILFLFLASGDDKKSNQSNNSKNLNIEWETIMSQDIAQTSDDWGTPKMLPFSTRGWEEGNYISSDGNTFYFIYTTVDIFRFVLEGDKTEVGPLLDIKKQCSHRDWPDYQAHNCGSLLKDLGVPRADLFYVQKTTDGWSEPKPHPLTLEAPVGGVTMVDNKAYFMIAFTGTVESIGYSEKINGKWNEPMKIESVSSDYSDSDPYVNNEDNEMFFWSDRPAKFAGKNIYHSIKVGGEWQAPEILPKPINSDGDDMQTFLFGDDLYFASDQGDGGKIKIWKSQRSENNWREPELVISSNFAVGEPSLTADGKYLYFEQIFTDGNNNFNPEMMYVERK